MPNRFTIKELTSLAIAIRSWLITDEQFDKDNPAWSEEECEGRLERHEYWEYLERKVLDARDKQKERSTKKNRKGCTNDSL